MTAESAADWFCNFIVNQTPVSPPIAPIPIKPGRALATIVGVAPPLSRNIREIRPKIVRVKSGDIVDHRRQRLGAISFSVSPALPRAQSRPPCEHVDDAQCQWRAD